MTDSQRRALDRLLGYLNAMNPPLSSGQRSRSICARAKSLNSQNPPPTTSAVNDYLNQHNLPPC
jgi:hypothetical protein